MPPSPPEPILAERGAALAAAPPVLFSNHRGVVPMLWVFASLALVELMVVHFVLALKWPMVAWPLSLVTALAIVWNIAWIRSWRRLPHELHAETLRLHVGSLRKVEVPLDTIVLVHGRTDGELLKRRDTHNMVPMAHPNRVIEVRDALPGRRAARRVAIRVDDPLAFDRAMRGAGKSVE